MRFDEPGLDAYLKEINQFRLLTAEEEAALARRVSRHDKRRATRWSAGTSAWSSTSPRDTPTAAFRSWTSSPRATSA